MSRVAGSVKTGGRQKGSLNKRNELLREVMDRLNCRPEEVLARICNGERIMSLAYTNKETGEFVEYKVMPSLQMIKDAASDLMQYRWSKLKALEHSGSIGTHETSLDELR